MGEPAQEAPTSSTPERVEAEIEFERGNGLEAFLRAIERICQALDRQPNQLYYVLHGIDAGEWDDPVSFAPSNWESAYAEVQDGFFGWQIDFLLRGQDYEIEGHANPGYWTKIFVSGSPALVERVQELAQG
ncbi:MAG: hypothetical protein JXA37_14565 [Chloroflexia bacterium]|nr:hypothetical protein [Chloroflexia bacterium]